jgi:hypothetical protein
MKVGLQTTSGSTQYYAFCPDNTLLLANLAGRTSQIALGTGAVIPPWNDPLRAAEKISFLDHLTGGRVLFGLGRGLARNGYESSGSSWTNRGTVSTTSAPAWSCSASAPGRTRRRPSTHTARASANGTAPSPAGPSPVTSCTATQTLPGPRTKRTGTSPGYLSSVMQHYALASGPFKDAKGYESYGNAVDLMKAIGLDKMCEMYLGVQAWGTPDQIIDRWRARRDVIGDFDLTACFRLAGVPIADAERILRKIAADVLPILREPTTTT